MRGPGQTTVWGVHSEQRQVGHTPELAQMPVPMGRIPHLALRTGDARDANRQPRYTTRTVPTSDRSIHPRAGGEVGHPLGCDPAISSHLLTAGLAWLAVRVKRKYYLPWKGVGKERDHPCGGRVSSSPMPSSRAMPACTILARKAWSRLPPPITEERVMRIFEHLASARPQTWARHLGGAGPVGPQGKKSSKHALAVELLDQSLAANGQLVSSVQRRPLVVGSPGSTPPKSLAWRIRGAHRRYLWRAGEAITKCAVVIG
jgi:hypothetical protein